MDEKTQGAWIVHHGRKVASAVRGASEYSTIDFAAKSATLLARMSGTDESRLTSEQVTAAAKIGGLNPRLELEPVLAELAAQRLIDRGKDGSVAVLGLSNQSSLAHASTLFEASAPEPFERAAIGIAEIASNAPVRSSEAAVYVGDTYRLTRNDTADFLRQASEIGFIDSEGEGDDKLLFNGNLFRRETAAKTSQVLASLTAAEQSAFHDFDAQLRVRGSIIASAAERMLGAGLFSKLRAAAIYDMNIVSNESGDHVFITSPGAFHKFTDPLIDDAFDHAKALVAALSYGMSVSRTERGRIWGISLLVNKLIRGDEVGPATAIGNDYRALELEHVIAIRPVGSLFKMRLLKREVGELALAVLQGGSAAADALETLPSAGMRGYTGPEAARTSFRTKRQSSQSKAQTRTLLSAVRGGGGL